MEINVAIPKKGSRKIIVDDIEYRWYIRRKPAYGQLIEPKGLTFAVENPADDKIPKLIVYTPYDRPDGIGGSPAIIRPQDIEKAIRLALKSGWGSSSNQKPFHLSITVGELIDDPRQS